MIRTFMYVLSAYVKILQHIYVRTYKYRIRLLLDWSNYQESPLENEYELVDKGSI